MKTLLLLLLLATSIFSSGQVYHPFPTDSAEWCNVTYYDDQTQWNGPTYKMTGEDTLINGITYSKLFDYANYIGAIREDSIKRIYFNRADSTNEYLLYDFSLSAGDTIWVWGYTCQGSGLHKFTIYSEDSILLANGEWRRVLNVEQGGYDNWIEGIGSTYGLLSSGFSCLAIHSLTCFIHNGIFVYSNPVGIEETNNFQTQLIISPNPFSTQLTFSLAGNEQTTVSLHNFLGQQVLQQTFTNSTTINTEQLADGIFFYELRNNKGALKTGKIIKQ